MMTTLAAFVIYNISIMNFSCLLVASPSAGDHYTPEPGLNLGESPLRDGWIFDDLSRKRCQRGKTRFIKNT